MCGVQICIACRLRTVSAALDLREVSPAFPVTCFGPKTLVLLLDLRAVSPPNPLVVFDPQNVF